MRKIGRLISISAVLAAILAVFVMATPARAEQGDSSIDLNVGVAIYPTQAAMGLHGYWSPAKWGGLGWIEFQLQFGGWVEFQGGTDRFLFGSGPELRPIIRVFRSGLVMPHAGIGLIEGQQKEGGPYKANVEFRWGTDLGWTSHSYEGPGIFATIGPTFFQRPEEKFSGKLAGTFGLLF